MLCIHTYTCMHTHTHTHTYIHTHIHIHTYIHTYIYIHTYTYIHTSYLYSLLHDYIPIRALRSSDQHLLENLKSSIAKASRAFRHLAPVVWNNLSANTPCATSPVSFKQLLKTELFAAAFGS